MSTLPEIKYTPEQLAAAKAFVRNCDTVEHRDILRDYMALGRMTPGVASQHILLAALEAAEADSARLEWLVEHPESEVFKIATSFSSPWQYYVTTYDQSRNFLRQTPHFSTAREAIDAARKAQS